MFKNVIVGVDDNDGSRDAIALAERLVERGGELTLAYAHGRTAVDGTRIEDLVDQARQQIAALGDVEPHAAYGHPAEELALYLARSARCPLLVLTRGARQQLAAGEESATGDAAVMSKA